MLAPDAEMQKFCCSTEALSITNAVTLEDVLHNDGAASVLIHLLELEDKRSLRLVCHAGKDAVDKTVTAVYMPGEEWTRLAGNPCKVKCSMDYASVLYSSNWKGIKSLAYSPTQRISSGRYYESQGLTQIAEAGLSKLESLTLRFIKDDEQDATSADKLVKAGWKLKALDIDKMPSEWFGTLARDANWPLEELTIHACTDSIAALIAVSEWKLKKLYLDDLSSESVETLMQGSWVSTVEKLALSFALFQSGNIKEKKAIRAISQASHRAVNLLQLIIESPPGFDNKAALILAEEGSFPNLEHMCTPLCIKVSGIAAILRKCPKLQLYDLCCYAFQDGLHPVDDPEDAKLVAEHYKNGLIRIIQIKQNYEFQERLADYL